MKISASEYAKIGGLIACIASPILFKIQLPSYAFRLIEEVLGIAEKMENSISRLELKADAIIEGDFAQGFTHLENYFTFAREKAPENLIISELKGARDEFESSYYRVMKINSYNGELLSKIALLIALCTNTLGLREQAIQWIDIAEEVLRKSQNFSNEKDVNEIINSIHGLRDKLFIDSFLV